MDLNKLKSPYPYFGGKSRVAPIVWKGLGSVSNYIEPFAGSAAMLLANPNPAKIETINDIDHFLTNFWRSVSQDPDTVAKYAEYPVHETELHARHKYLIQSATPEFTQKMHDDIHFYDAEKAGYWVYGIGASVGNNWLQPKGLNAMPMLSSAGGGVHGLTHNVKEWMHALQKRTKRVRVTCGDWKKILTPSISYNSKGLSPKEITGVFLDPPYSFATRDKVYKEDNDIFHEVLNWAIDNGNNPRLRIALCGYQENQVFPEGWITYSWETNGGMAALGNGQGKDNAKKEVIWFSPHCLSINI